MHKGLLLKVQQELSQPVNDLNLPIAALRDQIRTHVGGNVCWYAFPMDDALSDAQWVSSVLPRLLIMSGSGNSDRMRAQVKMVEVMHDPVCDLRSVLGVTRDSDVYIALRGLVELHVKRTQKALHNAGISYIEMQRRGDRRELRCNFNEARSWTTSLTGADTGNYGGNVVFNARVPVEHIAAIRDVWEQEILVSRESLDGERKRLHLSLRKEPGRSWLQKFKDWYDERKQ